MTDSTSAAKEANLEAEALIKDFINNGNPFMKKKLGFALIENFGGIQAFLDDYKLVNLHGIKGGYGSFVYYNSMIRFYTLHEKQMRSALKEIAESMNFPSLGDMAWELAGLDSEWSKDEVLEAVYQPVKKMDEDMQGILCSFYTQLLGSLICENYSNFLLEKESGEVAQ